MAASAQDHIFNQYFLDFLKRLKAISKDIKHDSHDARTILRSIKKHYQSNDKLSTEFRSYMASHEHAWEAYRDADNDAIDKWLDDHVDDACLFKDMGIGALTSVVSDKSVLHHYFTILNIFRPDLSDAVLEQVVGVLRNLNGLADKKDEIKESIDKIEVVEVRSQLHRIVSMASSAATGNCAGGGGPNMSELENTSLGKLAKEIMGEVNIEELQKSLGNGDIMQALANPDGGLVKLLGTVSQKMISKMSSGEIKQENLLQDAMKLATQLGGPNLGPLGDIAKMFGAGDAGGPGGFDMSSLAKMMGSMGGGGRVRPNTANLKRMARARDLRQKLDDKRNAVRAKENIGVHVEEDA